VCCHTVVNKINLAYGNVRISHDYHGFRKTESTDLVQLNCRSNDSFTNKLHRIVDMKKVSGK
jgi:hypothetical protein